MFIEPSKQRGVGDMDEDGDMEEDGDGLGAEDDHSVGCKKGIGLGAAD